MRVEDEGMQRDKEEAKEGNLEELNGGNRDGWGFVRCGGRDSCKTKKDPGSERSRI